MIGNQLHSRRRVLGRLDLPYANIKTAYQFDGNANDYYGLKNGTPSNMAYGTGLGDNKAGIFNGTDSWITLPTGLNPLTTSYSFSFLFKANITSYRQLIALDQVGEGYVAIRLNRLAANEINLNIKSTTGQPWHDVACTVTNWNHVVVIITNNVGYKMYLNATNVVDATMGAKGTLGSNNNVMGASRSYTIPFDGMQAAYKFWDIALTPTQISTLATAELAGINILA